MTDLTKQLIVLAVASIGFIDSSGAAAPPAAGKTVSLFDGTTLVGWEGSAKIWRVEGGCLTGGSYEETVKQNEFLATTRDYTNFIVRFQIKLTGSNGFINSGFQMRSQRVPNNSEMAGYQCDYGEPNWYGAVYDESRRNKVMSPSDMKALDPVIKRQDWNDYVIRADGPRVTTWINGVMGTDYTEADPAIPDWGKLGIQVHGGGKAVVQVRKISIEELPPTPPGKKFIGAPEPKKTSDNTGTDRGVAQTASTAEPVSAEEEKTRFTLPPGFEIELVAQESEGIGKFVAVDWDLHGNLWTMTALEYPVDGNENPAAARELYASKAKDKVVVFDRDAKSPTGYSSRPRVFADGLAIPLGILPYKNGVYVQHGTEIVFLSDTDGDGKADKREVILSGFGVQDSHLFPHQFTRAPGGWIWFAQGAFNYGKVKTTKGAEVQFDQTRMAKFRYDGSDFEITSQGPCNIWGLAMTAEGETWIQEANDYGYPAMPFHEYANYPGCSTAQFKSYAPEFPGTAPDFQMGGTGLSGLAMTDGWRSGISNLKSQIATWPEAYCDVMYVANPITRKIQAIKIHRDGPRYRLQKLPDFIQSSDEMFRPVALRLGPDGCLYFVDWYNKIISHNEVARNHPDRDKKRGRIWRVKYQDAKPLEVPDFMKLSGDELIAKLGGENTTQSHLAWQAIGDRQLKELASKLKGIIGDKSRSAGRRIAALWALEGLHAVDTATLTPLLRDDNRNIRRETVRALGEAKLIETLVSGGSWMIIYDLNPLSNDPDPEVRAELIRSIGLASSRQANLTNNDSQEVPAYDARLNAGLNLLIEMARPSLDGPTMKSTQNGKVIKSGEAYEREFERYLVRKMLEEQPVAVAKFLTSRNGNTLPVENRLLATLALEPKTGATLIAGWLPLLTRQPSQEELLCLAQFPEESAVAAVLKKILQEPATSLAAIESLLKVRTRLDAAKITPLLNDTAKQLLTQNDPATLELGIKLASSFQLAAVEPELVRVLEQGWDGHPKPEAREYLLRPESLAALKALRELKSDRVDLFAKLAERGGPAEQQAAVGALAASQDVTGPQQLASLYPNLSMVPRRTALTALSGTKTGAGVLVKAVRAGSIPKDELDAAILEKLRAVLGNDKNLAELMEDMAAFLRPILRLDGTDNAWADADITLDGPFTVEAWVKLDPGIDNNDGILGAPAVLDMNFFAGQFRVWVGGGLNDVIVAKKKITADVWTHLAVTRNGEGRFCIYQNGELDNDQGKPANAKFEHLRVGWTAPAKGTAGWLNEFRVWNRVRSANEIRADFDRSFEGEPRPDGLVQIFGGTNWVGLKAGARVERTSDFPALLSPAEAKAMAEKFRKFHGLAVRSGEAAKGRMLFTTLCMSCHSVGGQGGQVGPVLNGAGASGIEALLRNILTPNAAMEAGYRAFRVELKDGDVLDGILISRDDGAIMLRRPNSEDTRIPMTGVRRADFTRRSMMPEGLLDGLAEKDVTDLFAYLGTLK